MKDSDAIIAELSDAALMALATAVEAGWLGGSSPDSTFASMAGQNGAAVAAWLVGLEDAAFTPAQTARLLRSIVAGRHRDQVLVPDLVVSGPDVPGVPTADTYAVVQSLFQEAQNEIVLAGYAFHNGRLLFERLAEQKRLRPQLRIIFHIAICRGIPQSPLAMAAISRGLFRSQGAGHGLAHPRQPACQSRRCGPCKTIFDLGQFHRGSTAAKRRDGTSVTCGISRPAGRRLL